MADLTSNPDQLSALVDFMRARGIRRLDIQSDGVRVIELFGPLDAPRAPLVPLDSGAVENPEVACNCGHEEYQHDPMGRCLEGCLPDDCRKPRAGA